MQTVATMALTPGMIIGNDVKNSNNQLIVAKKTEVNAIIIAKLNRHSIMCVDIMEPEDLATTHLEKIRLSKSFQNFVEVYNRNLEIYKSMIRKLIYENKKIESEELLRIYTETSNSAPSREHLLDYLYNMLPSVDNTTYAHCMNSALIAGVFGNWLCLPDDEIIQLVLTGFLYDIGKLMLSPDILYKPGKLTDSEFMHIKSHTYIGFHLIKDQNLDKRIMAATLQHHEKCDGKGYPKGLTDNEIGLFPKMISIIDAYEAMTSARTYRNTLTPFQVVGNFEKTSYNYSNIVLTPILSHIANSQLGMTVRLSDDSVAEIMLVNPAKLSRPLVKCGLVMIDLAVRTDLEIVAIL